MLEAGIGDWAKPGKKGARQGVKVEHLRKDLHGRREDQNPPGDLSALQRYSAACPVVEEG